MKRRYLGTIRFIGELFMMSMLTVRIMHECVERLLSGYKKTKDEDRLEWLLQLPGPPGKNIPLDHFLLSTFLSWNGMDCGVPVSTVRMSRLGWVMVVGVYN